MLGTEMSLITRSQRRTKMIVASVVGAFLFASVPTAAHAAESTFTFDGVAAEFLATGDLIFTGEPAAFAVSHSEEDDVSSFWIQVSNPSDETVQFLIDSVAITGVTDLTKSSSTTYLWAGTELSINIATAPGNYLEGLTNAAVTLSLTELIPSTITNSTTGSPAGISINSATGVSFYYDESSNKTCVWLRIDNSSNTNYTLRFRGSVTHGSDTVNSEASSYVYVPKRSYSNFYPFPECVPGNFEFNDSVNLTGTLVKVKATSINSKKVKLPKGLTISISANDISYDAVAKKSYISLRIIAPANSTSVLRAVSMKLNGKKLAGAVVSEGYVDEVLNKKIYNLDFKSVSGDFRSGKALTFVAKILKEKATPLSVSPGLYTGLGEASGTAWIPGPANWVYDAKKKVTRVTLILSNYGDTNISMNFSRIKLETKVKKKGKFKTVTLKPKFTTKLVRPGGFGPSWGGTFFEIPGDVRTNGKAIKVTGATSAN